MLSEPSGVSNDFIFFPQNLKKLGYHNYMVGKWHLGYCKRAYLPTARGFDYFYGYYGPQQGYFNHSSGYLNITINLKNKKKDLFRYI